MEMTVERPTRTPLEELDELDTTGLDSEVDETLLVVGLGSLVEGTLPVPTEAGELVIDAGELVVGLVVELAVELVTELVVGGRVELSGVEVEVEVDGDATVGEIVIDGTDPDDGGDEDEVEPGYVGIGDVEGAGADDGETELVNDTVDVCVRYSLDSLALELEVELVVEGFTTGGNGSVNELMIPASSSELELELDVELRLRLIGNCDDEDVDSWSVVDDLELFVTRLTCRGK